MARGAVDYTTAWRKGHLHMVDNIPNGDETLGPALRTYSDTLNKNRQSLHWQRAVKWIEHVFFSAGRHYINDILTTRLARNTTNDELSIIQESAKNIPKPTNDLLGRYIETNIALLTENRPRPRITPKSDRSEDVQSAELSELTMEYLWEALNMPEKSREIVRMLLHTGVCWLEVGWDPTRLRRMAVPETRETTAIAAPEGIPGAPPVTTGVTRQIEVLDKSGKPVMREKVDYGEIVANIVSPFEFHMPSIHEWNSEEMGWVMREMFVPIDVLKDKYGGPKTKMGLTKANGWYVDNLNDLQAENITSLPLWWWERVSELVEGPGPSIYIGSPDYWEGHTIVRIFDRKPNTKWPKGRTIITAGDKVIYDSPKKVGARAYDSRWPDRWHPYVRFRWEGQTGSPYGRSLVSKLLPKLKRVNSIDSTLIMWRRTVPIATWVAPKGSTVTEDIWSGMPGRIWQYDPRRTAAAKPEPVYPPDYPAAAIEERNTQIAEMEAISGTEEVLRGQRPTGVNSAMMLDVLRKQALMSRSAILQAWDESLQSTGSSMLQETIKHVGTDLRFAERLSILAREKASRLSISDFSGRNLSDNVQVRVDTASAALVSKEAREAKVLEFLRVAPNLMAITDISLRQAILEELNFGRSLNPSGPDVDKAKKFIQWIKQERYERLIPSKYDDPYVFFSLLRKEFMSESWWNLNATQQTMLRALIQAYEKQIQAREQAQQEAMLAMAQAGIDQGGE